jgi:hypothetical protein
MVYSGICPNCRREIEIKPCGICGTWNYSHVGSGLRCNNCGAGYFGTICPNDGTRIEAVNMRRKRAKLPFQKGCLITIGIFFVIYIFAFLISLMARGCR